MKSPEELACSRGVVRIVNRLLLHMLKTDSDEFSVQPTANKLRVLSDFKALKSFQESRLKGVVLRLKIMADLPIDSFDTEQEGRIDVTVCDETISFAVCSLHNPFGQGIIVRRVRVEEV